MQDNGSGKPLGFWSFFKPSVSKIFFLGASTAYVSIELLQGRVYSSHMLWLAAYPLLFFYLIACVLSAASLKINLRGATFKLMAFGLGLSLTDQAPKLWVDTFVTNGASLPILDVWLHLAHIRNLVGSWVLQSLGLDQVGVLMPVVMAVVAATLLLSGLIHRYYTALHRHSLWADVVLTMYFAGFTSFLADMLLRGYILDYIHLPGLIAVDLKDIFLTIGTAALLGEVRENPAVSLRWGGWRAEWTSLKSEARGLADYAKADLHRIH